MTVFFSIIIPVYNKEKHIKATLDSVFNQSYKNFEVLIVNDGSTDRSMEIVSTIKDDRIQIINKANEGVSKARNFGIQTAKKDYIALLDADDTWHPNHLENLNDLIKNFPDCGLFCTAYETSYYNKKIVKGRYLRIGDGFFGIVPNYFENCLVDSIAWTSAVAIPRLIFEKYGYFDVDLGSGQDTEFWIRIALQEKVAFSSKISARKIISDDGNHLSLSKKRKDRLKILERFKEAEKINYSLKKYMDINRFSIALERKINGDIENFKAIIQDIELSNLNTKQRFLLKLPRLTLYFLKQFQVFLLKNNVYLTSFR